MVQDDPLDGGGPVLPTGPYVDMLAARGIPAGDLNWWTGGHGLVLADPEPLPEPIPWRKGRLGIWTMPDELAGRVRRAAA